MSRNMKLANQNIFSALIDFALKRGCEISGAGEIRYIQSNSSEQHIIKKLSILQKEKVTPLMEFALCILDSERFLIVVGPKVPDENFGNIFEYVQIDSGWFTSISSEMHVGVRTSISPYQIANTLNDRHANSIVSYYGHRFTDISLFFKDISVFRLSVDAPFSDEDFQRMVGAFLCFNSELLSIDLNQALSENYKKMFLEGPENLPYESILDSLTSMRWKDAFLDIYRCIERLFPFFYMNTLRSRTAIGKSLDELITIVEDVLGWRAKEDIALKAIFSRCDSFERGLFQAVKKKILGDDQGDIGGALVYRLRNSIVHDRARDEKLHTKLTDEDWRALIQAMLVVVRNEYVKYRGMF